MIWVGWIEWSGEDDFAKDSFMIRLWKRAGRLRNMWVVRDFWK